MCFCNPLIRTHNCGSVMCKEYNKIRAEMNQSPNNTPEETMKPDVPKPYKFDHELAWKRMWLLYPIVYGANCGTPTLNYTPYDGFAIRGKCNDLIGKGTTIEYAIQTAYAKLRGQVLDMQAERQNQIDKFQIALSGKIEE
ncbi:hypothetical protein UFOVP1290_156 [uncultured Caudovirales phage]|uniref:Uncharacterized protein n=1 Tax=uncultured Caudovirales phage TaxID=2100421 RepID=A0A6J5RQS0_9CAUD|nr:hypothetical protein UFOVP1290_156 [uncultured Caudovirales phage]